MKTIKSYNEFCNEELNFKKAITGAALSAGLLSSNPASSQISTVKFEPVKQKSEVVPYDSTQNQVADLYRIIGQDLYFLKTSQNFRYFSNETLNQKMFTEEYFLKRTKSQKYLDKSKAVDGSDKYYKLLDIETIDYYVGSHPRLNYPYKVVLKIQENQTKNIFYYPIKFENPTEYSQGSYKFGLSDYRAFPFIIVGFYNKQRQVCIGSVITISNATKLPNGEVKLEDLQLRKNSEDIAYQNSIISSDSSTDAPTDQIVGQWTCVDLSINEKDNQLSLIFKKDENKLIIPFFKLFEDIESNKSKIRTKPEYRSSGGSSMPCLSGNANVKLLDGTYKKIKDIKETDYLSNGIVKKLIVTEVEDMIDMVDMGEFYITPGHLILKDERWIRPDSIYETKKIYVDKVYNIQLHNNMPFESNGVVCIPYTEIYSEGKKFRLFVDKFCKDF